MYSVASCFDCFASTLNNDPMLKQVEVSSVRPLPAPVWIINDCCILVIFWLIPCNLLRKVLHVRYHYSFSIAWSYYPLINVYSYNLQQLSTFLRYASKPFIAYCW